MKISDKGFEIGDLISVLDTDEWAGSYATQFGLVISKKPSNLAPLYIITVLNEHGIVHEYYEDDIQHMS